MNDKIRAYGDTPAFPSQIGSLTAGISKREYFAGLAMQGIISHGIPSGVLISDKEYASRRAVQYADALLEEIAKK